MGPSESALIAAVEAGDESQVSGLVSAEPALATARDESGVSALMLAKYRSNAPVVAALLGAGQPLDVFEAATLDDAGALQEIIRNQPRLVTAWSADGFTALHFAAFFGGVAAATVLLDAGADADAVSRNDMRVAPLNSAAAGQREVALLLIARGADVDAQQRHGWSALHAAADEGDTELVEALLDAGAGPSLTTDSGRTAAQQAELKGHADLARRLDMAASGQSSPGSIG